MKILNSLKTLLLRILTTISIPFKFIYRLLSPVLNRIFKFFKFLWPHLPASLSLLPALIALWIAFPTIKVDTGDYIYEFSGLQPFTQYNPDTGTTTIISRAGFREGTDFQNGVAIMYEVAKTPVTPTVTPTVSVTPTPTPTTTSTPTPTPTITPVDLDKVNDDILTSLDIFARRLNAAKFVDPKIYLLDKDNKDKSKILVTFSENRTDIGIAPYYLGLKGEIEIWVDDPNYVVPDEESQDETTYNPTEGRVKTNLTRDDIAYAQTVIDAKTYGPGIRLAFKPEAIDELNQYASQIGASGQAFGFLVLIDGQPILYQSYQFTVTLDNAIYMTSGFSNSLNVINSIESVINSPVMPMSLSSVSNLDFNAHNVDNVNNVKAVLFVGIVLFLVFIVIRLKSQAMPVVFTVFSTITIAIALLKLWQQELNVALIVGVLIIIVVTALLLINNIKHLVNISLHPKDKFNQELSIFNRSYRNLAILLFAVAVIFDTTNIGFMRSFGWGMVFTLIAGFASIWLTYKYTSIELLKYFSEIKSAKNSK